MIQDEKPIILIGPMGVGKTTIGKKLAKALDRKFVDTDKVIVAEHGDITKIFETRGEQEFRKIEHHAIAANLRPNVVLATGGGAVTHSANHELLNRGFVIYLSTNGKHMASRLRFSKRPLIKNGMTDWRRIYDERRSLYEGAADMTVDTSTQALATTIEIIKARVNEID
jgi:shikimate kinase